MFSNCEDFQYLYSVPFHILHGSHSVFGYPNNRISKRCPVPSDSDKRRSTEQSAKVSVGSGLPVSNQVIPAWKRKRSAMGFHRSGSSGSSGRGRELDNTNALAEDFIVNQSAVVRRLKKLGKVWRITGWVPHEL
ncbi:hypothetical protein TNCV_3797461 [Trichonephila clavipes]|nr:hypothetical protein TNCV_3797461 [Trichonephila clavipes]